MTRIYDEKKVQRLIYFKNVFNRKLRNMLANRTPREKLLQREITEIENSYIRVKCTSCGKYIEIPFKKYKSGSHLCEDCKCKQESVVISSLIDEIKQNVSLPLEYDVINASNKYQLSIMIRKKRPDKQE
jgi:hypothetical protein